jgi:hypothetical protein
MRVRHRLSVGLGAALLALIGARALAQGGAPPGHDFPIIVKPETGRNCRRKNPGRVERSDRS